MTDTYRLTFRDGTPVQVGQLQEWLAQLRADEEVDDDEFIAAVNIVRQIRAHLN